MWKPSYCFPTTIILRKYKNENSEKIGYTNFPREFLPEIYLKNQRFFRENYLKKGQYTELNLRLLRMGCSVSRKKCRQPALIGCGRGSCPTCDVKCHVCAHANLEKCPAGPQPHRAAACRLSDARGGRALHYMRCQLLLIMEDVTREKEKH